MVFVWVSVEEDSRWPALSCRDSEQGQKGPQDVVIMEFILLPLARLRQGHSITAVLQELTPECRHNTIQHKLFLCLYLLPFPSCFESLPALYSCFESFSHFLCFFLFLHSSSLFSLLLPYVPFPFFPHFHPFFPLLFHSLPFLFPSSLP